MRKIFFLLAFVSLLKTSSGQESCKRWEFGSTLVTVGMYYSGYFPPGYDLMNGLFFRYTKTRLALRLHMSHSDKTNSYTFTSADAPYFWGRNIHSKDLKIGVGGQLSILKQKEWLYAFMDLSYRNVYTTGYEFGFWNEFYTITANGVDGFAGIGLKLKAAKYFYLSPELGFYSTTQFGNITTTLADTYNPTTGALVTYKRAYSFTDLSPVLKLHLTVSF